MEPHDFNGKAFSIVEVVRWAEDILENEDMEYAAWMHSLLKKYLPPPHLSGLIHLAINRGTEDQLGASERYFAGVISLRNDLWEMIDANY
jgi:hypothetical protein